MRVPYGEAGGHAEGYGRPACEPEGVRGIYAMVRLISARYDAQTCLTPNNSCFLERGTSTYTLVGASGITLVILPAFYLHRVFFFLGRAETIM